MRAPFQALFGRRAAADSGLSPFLQAMLRGVSSSAGKDVTEATALNVAAVYTGVSIRSRLLSTLPVDIIEYSADGLTRVPAPSHPVAPLLKRPNAFQTWPEFAGMGEAHRLLRGNLYAYTPKRSAPAGDGAQRDFVTEMIPMHPDQVQVLEDPADPGGSSRYRFTKKNGQVIEFAEDEVLHIRGFSTNGRTGRSFLADLRDIIGGSLALRDHANSLWTRDATPSVVLSHPKTLKGQAARNLEDTWEQTYGRDADRKRVAVLEEGMTITPLSISPEDGQFLETDQDLRAQLAAALMVPPHLMGLSEKATSWGSGIEQQVIGLQTFTLVPDCVIWEARLNRALIRAPRYGIKFNTRAVLRGDLQSQAFWFRVMREIGAYSANDIRRLVDENPIANGDVYLQPVNFAPLGYDPSKGAGGGAGGAA